MADAKISALTELAAADVAIATDFLAIVDTTAGATKKISPNHVFGVGTARQVVRTNAGATALEWGTPITLGTMQTAGGETELDFTGIPALVKKITIMFNGFSLSGTDRILVQIGDSGGFETSGYVSSGCVITAAAGTDVSDSTAGFIIRNNAAGDAFSGAMTLDLIDASTFAWISSHSGKITTTATVSGGGNKSLSAELTQVRITRTGTDTIDAGSVNISYE